MLGNTQKSNPELRRFMSRALATEMFDFEDEADEPQATCPVCMDRKSSTPTGYFLLTEAH